MWNDFIELNLFVKFYFKKKSIDFKSFKKSKTQNEIWFAKKKIINLHLKILNLIKIKKIASVDLTVLNV